MSARDTSARKAERETIVYVVRHAHIPSHEHDVSLTEAGWQAAEQAGRAFAGRVGADEVTFLHGPARRTEQTALAMYRGITNALQRAGMPAQVSPPTAHAKLCNFRMWVDGYLQEAMRILHDAVHAACQEMPSPQNAARLAYHDAFWSHPTLSPTGSPTPLPTRNCQRPWPRAWPR
ncbi:MAG: phosphoglycerate mutase family protein [Ardenticatenia bacterium]|nr:phosphoglycerate mutase family protein [Ardenticatenia bacterium]